MSEGMSEGITEVMSMGESIIESIGVGSVRMMTDGMTKGTSVSIPECIIKYITEGMTEV